jgi:hypothetical protein
VPDQGQEDGLEGVLAVGLGGHNAPANAPHQRGIAFEQLLEGGGVAPAGETRQQFRIRCLRARPAQGATTGDQREQRCGRHHFCVPKAKT